MPKAAERQGRRHNPLEHDITAIGPLRTKPGKRKSQSQDEENFVDSKASRKILRIGQELADEEEEANRVLNPQPNIAFNFESRFEDEEEQDPYDEDAEAWGDEEEIVEMDELSPADQAMFSKFLPEQEDELLSKGWGGEANEIEQGPGINLADLILERIAEYEATAARAGQSGEARDLPGPPDDDFEIPAKVVEVYTKWVWI
jgi:essential nuclear protein 1